MTHVPEDDVNEAVRSALKSYHGGATVVGDGGYLVRGRRYADLAVENRPSNMRRIAVEVENATGDYRDGLAQALHYRRAGYVPVLALPLDHADLKDPDTDSGEILNVAAEARVGLMGVWFENDEDAEGHAVTGASYVLRPWNE